MAQLVNDPYNPQPDDIWPVLDIITTDDWNRVAINERFTSFRIHVKVALAADPFTEKASKYIRVESIYSPLKRRVRYMISKEKLKTITDSLESIVFSLGQDCVLLNNHPNFRNFIMFHAADSLRYTVNYIPEDDENFFRDDMCTFNIGITVGHSRAIVKMLATKSPNTIGFNSTVTTNISGNVETDIMSFYMNCLLSLVPPDIHAEIIERMKPLALAGKVNLKKVSDDDYKECRATRVSVERVMMCALMVATSFTMREENEPHLIDWCEYLSKKMFAHARRKPIPVPPEFKFEIPAIAKNMSFHKEVREALLSPLLEERETQEVVNDAYEVVRAQINTIIW